MIRQLDLFDNVLDITMAQQQELFPDAPVPDVMLFINDVGFGGDTYVGSRQAFKVALADLFQQWHEQYLSERNQHIDIGNVSYEGFVEYVIDKFLMVATAEDIKNFPMLNA